MAEDEEEDGVEDIEDVVDGVVMEDIEEEVVDGDMVDMVVMEVIHIDLIKNRF